MPLPPAVGTVEIDFDIRHPQTGTPGNGTVLVTLPYALRDTTDHVILGSGTITALCVDGVGSITIPDPNDTDVSPQGWAPHVQVLTDVYSAEYDVVIPDGSAGLTLHLSDLAPAENPPQLFVYALASHTHSGGGGGSTPDATTTTKGILRLAGDLGGTATTPTVPGLATKYVKPGGGIPSSDLASAVQASLGKADTAVQPGSLAAVATSGAYSSLTGLPSIPDTFDDLTGTVPTSALPAIAITEYLGAVANQAAMLALVGQKGDWCTRTDLGTTWIITGNDPTQLASWTALSYPTAPVLSVNGQTGVVSLAKADVGLGNVSNLAPNDLPVSAATQTALDLKQAADSDLTAIAGLAPADGALLQRITGAWAARSLAGLKSDLSLDQVNNTSDTNKPVSSSTQTALDAKVAKATLTAKGDLYIATASGTIVRLPVGSDDQVLTADSAQTAGVAWADPAGGAVDIPSTADQQGFVGWTGDLLTWTTRSGVGDGDVSLVRLPISAGKAVSTLWVAVSTAGTYSATGKPNQLGIWDDTGALLSLTPDDSTLYTSNGWRSGALTTPVAASGALRYCYVGFIVGGQTGLQLYYPTSANSVGSTSEGNVLNGGPITKRRAVYLTAQSALPSSFNPATVGTVTAYMPLLAMSA